MLNLINRNYKIQWLENTANLKDRTEYASNYISKKNDVAKKEPALSNYSRLQSMHLWSRRSGAFSYKKLQK